MNIKFLTQNRQIRNLSLIYVGEDYSFDVEPLEESGETSIMINEVQLEIDHEGRIIYVWGYCPLIKYKETYLFPKKYQVKSLVALLKKPITLGISYRINEEERWPIFINKEQGWVCIGNPNIEKKELVEFVPHCIAVLENQEITAIWLQPQTLPKL